MVVRLFRRGSVPRLLSGSCLFAVVTSCSQGSTDTAPIERDPVDRAAAAAQHGGSPPDGELPPATQIEILAARGWYGFATRDFVFVDETRPTPPNNTYPGSPVRTLPTRVYYPAQPPNRTASPPPPTRVPVAAGTFPIVGYAHGLTSRGEPARFTCEHLATHGYVCVAPRFPLSSGYAPGGPTIADIGQQPRDLDFVMRRVASLGGADADLGTAVDASKRGIVGLSAGGLTVLLAAYHPTLRIPDIDAAVAHAPVSCFLGAPAYAPRSLPMLIVAGTADELVPPEGPRRAFSLAPPPVILAELLGGTHSGFLNAERPFVENSDDIECERLLAAGPQQGDAAFAASINAGAPGAFDPSGCSTGICQQQFLQTMGATRQQKLTRAATLAHFEAELRDDPLAEQFLRTGLDALPDVDVRAK